MARLRRKVLENSDDEQPPPQSTQRCAVGTSSAAPASTRRTAVLRQVRSDHSSADDSDLVPRNRSQSTRTLAPASKPQIRLAPLKSLHRGSNLTIQDDTPKRIRKTASSVSKTRPIESKSLFGSGIARSITPEIPSSIPSDDDDESCQPVPETNELPEAEEVEFEESIWCGSDGDSPESDDDLPSPSSFFPARRKQDEQLDLPLQLKALQIFDDDVPVTAKSPKAQPLPITSRPGSSSEQEDNNAIIRFSPPRLKKPLRKTSFGRPSTPPPAPESPGKLRSPTKLQSPSKRVPRIPTPPLRPSLDAFWTAEAVNDWNDQYSPQKPLKSPKKLFSMKPSLLDDDDSLPKVSPCKLLQSPSKRSKAEIQARKDWDVRKHDLATKFLVEVDKTITGGKVSELSASTGGIQIVWSKTLNSTAGRANWRRETTRSSAKDDPAKINIVHKHFASIELAEKVLTYSEEAETKLINVIAHEFCHLCNFMISNVKDQPHGTSFKQWGAKCSKAFADRGINVTTKHNYEIEYKYIWRCEHEDCGAEYKRHSKSIDPKRHRCGKCRANLLQIKPVPRGSAKTGAQSLGKAIPVDGNSNVKAAPLNGYAGYVKQHFASLKKSLPGASHKEVMEALGKQYRAEKAAKTTGTGTGDVDVEIDDVAKKLDKVHLKVQEVIELD